MPLPNEEFGRAVRDAIQWMGCTPDSAGPVLGIKTQTLNAMCAGIVPMRSLVIRFASEIAQRCEQSGDTPGWWRDVDAWLATAGYPPRRDPVPGADDEGAEAGSGGPPRRRIHLAPLPRPENDACADEPANHHYRPVYERERFGEEYAHIFWLLDRNGEKTHKFRYPAPVDYQRRAQQLKNDLATMTKAHFERRYARYRLDQ